jgi:hypothetical protein
MLLKRVWQNVRVEKGVIGLEPDPYVNLFIHLQGKMMSRVTESL